VSVLFALALTAVGVLLGVAAGAIQGFFGGKTDLAFQRFIEIWGSMPELYLLIIFSAVFAPSIALLLVLLSLFGWMGLSDYVRAEFLRNRQLDYVKAARALGVGSAQIIWRHILPNSLTPVVTFLPFRMSAAILALTSLDFLGLGVPPGTPSLGELLSQGKNNIDAWWISLSTFGVLVLTLLLLTFMGDALRDALDPSERPTRMTPERRGREGFAEDAEKTTSKAALLRPPRHFCVLCVAVCHVLQVEDLRSLRRQDRGARAWVVLDCARRKAGAGGRVGLGQDGDGAEPAALLARCARHRPGAADDGRGRDLLALPEREMRGVRGGEIAMVFQEPMTALNPLMTVGQQIAEVLS
jgi:ABC-type nitrate/sulfonate/bicarbonate transport system permease component